MEIEFLKIKFYDGWLPEETEKPNFGAVDFFSINTLTTGIYNSWITFDDLAFSNRISFFLLLFIFAIFILENLSRKKARY